MAEKITILTAKDLEISYFIGSGAGGQNRQKNHTGVHMVHKESGAIGRCSEGRSQVQNKKQAFKNLCAHPKMKMWMAEQVYTIQNGKTVEQVVEEWMQPDNLEIQVKNDDGKWIDVDSNDPLN